MSILSQCISQSQFHRTVHNNYYFYLQGVFGKQCKDQANTRQDAVKKIGKLLLVFKQNDLQQHFLLLSLFFLLDYRSSFGIPVPIMSTLALLMT